MPVKLPAGQETRPYKRFVAHNQREAFRETIAAYVKVSTYADIDSHLMHAIKSLVDAGVDIKEAIATHDCKIKVRPVKGDNTKRVGIKSYFNAEDEQLLTELSALAGMSRPDFLHLIEFGTEPTRLKRQAGSKSLKKVSNSFDSDDYALLELAVSAEFGSDMTVARALRKVVLSWAQDVFEAHYSK